jgi:UDP-glucose:(heptosyl)LPS alpha-1,3-glucosyltransferase
MKLAIVRRNYNAYGGAERFVENLRAQLLRHGTSVSIIAENWAPTNDVLDSLVKIDVSGFSRAEQFRSFSKNAQIALSEKRFDVVQSHERLRGVDIFRLGDGVHAAWLERCAKVSNRAASFIRKLDPYNREIIRVESQMAQDDRLHFVATSKLVRDELKRFYNVPDNRVFMIPNGVDIKSYFPASADQKKQARKALGIPQTGKVVAFIGSDFARKGLWPLTEAIHMSQDLHLLVAGKDSSSGKLNRLIANAGKNSSIHYLGPRINIREILWASDVFALPSLYEPSSNAILEAMACGLPIVCTASVGNADIVKEGSCGYICDRSPESILESLLNVLSSDRYVSLSANCLRATEQLAQGPIFAKWLKLYEEVLAKKASLKL